MVPEPEFRRDPVCGRWAIVAPERALRPITLQGAEPRHRRNGDRTPCPFCPGQEHDTPQEVLAYREPGSVADGPGWNLRVVPNRFPAVRPDVGGAFCAVGGMVFLTTPGLGRSEIVIETADHVAAPTQLADEPFAAVFRAYRDRIIALSGDSLLAYASVFKNVGAEAGDSLGHTHSQIIATPVVPELVETELAGSREYLTRTRRCVFCDLIARELASGARVVVRSEQFLVVTAFAPRFAHELWVLPIAHASRFESITDESALELARIVKRALTALDVAESEPAYNWCLHTAPLRSPDLAHYHWHIEVLPRTARPAGLEWGYGCFITTVAPEIAAAELRAVLPR